MAGKNKIIVVILILAAAAAVLIFVYYKNQKKQDLLAVEKQIQTSGFKEQILKTALAKSTVNIPAAASKRAATLPSFLEIFVPKDTIEKTVSEVTYQGGKTGYQIKLTTNTPVVELFNNYFEQIENPDNGGWLGVTFFKNHLYSLMELSNIKYQVKILLGPSQNGKTQANIDLIEG